VFLGVRIWRDRSRSEYWRCCLIALPPALENDAKSVRAAFSIRTFFLGAAFSWGEDCEVHPHTSIGSDGFGYAVDATAAVKSRL